VNIALATLPRDERHKVRRAKEMGQVRIKRCKLLSRTGGRNNICDILHVQQQPTRSVTRLDP
jgi:hypothetical protein